MRHYVRLSRLNHSIDSGMYPLGSCTMKHNPRLNEKMARLPGFADIHPLQPLSTVQGALELMNELSHWLMTLTNTAAVALSPKAGAHGELLGMMAVKAAQDAAGQGHRRIVLVPESAHGTNPATAAFLGYSVRPIPARADGTVDAEAVKANFEGAKKVAADTGGAAYGSSYIQGFDHAEVVNPATVKLVFAHPNASFLQATSTTTLSCMSLAS
jgi:glycine dehydrogenase subunit 2